MATIRKSKHAAILFETLDITGKAQKLPGLVSNFNNYEAELNLTAADCVAFAEGLVRYFRTVGLFDYHDSGRYDDFPEVDLNFCNGNGGDVLVHAVLICFSVNPVPDTTKALLAEKTRNANRLFKLFEEFAQPILLRELGVVAFPHLRPNVFNGSQQVNFLCRYFLNHEEKWLPLRDRWALEDLLPKRDEARSARGGL